MSPKISIFTPSHDISKLNRAYQSILSQNYSDWEWVILLNGGAKNSQSELFSILKIKKNDKKVKVFTTKNRGYVGDLKHEACSLCKWEYLLELDHDDELLPKCLEKISEAINESDFDFLYSDTVMLDPAWNMQMFGEQFGWDHVVSEHGMSSITPKPHPVNWSKIFFQPNHFRCWKKSFYDKIGWHDESLKICDDQDLICRTFLNTKKIKHIAGPYYKQNLSNKSTQFEYNKEIAQKNWELYHKYFIQMCDNFFDKKYDFGGWISKKEWYISVDVNGGDINCDLNSNFEEVLGKNSAGIIRCHDLIEHIKDPIKFMNSLYDTLIDGWVADIMVPCSSGDGGFCDPTHVSFWNQRSFRYYTEEHMSKYVPEIKCKFMISHIDTIDYWENIPTIHYEYFGSSRSKKERLSYVRVHLVAIKSMSDRPKWLYLFS